MVRPRDEKKKILWQAHYDACWAVLQAAWSALLDEHLIYSGMSACQLLYRPVCQKEPPEWTVGTEGRGFDHATTIACAQHFAHDVLTQMLSLETFTDVPKFCQFPRDEKWKRERRSAWGRSFVKVIWFLNQGHPDQPQKRPWSLTPHLHDVRTQVVEKVVDEIGVFVVSKVGFFRRDMGVMWITEAIALGNKAGTTKNACYVLLPQSGATGMTVDAIMDVATSQRLCNWGAAKTPGHSVHATLRQDPNFVRIAPCTYALRLNLKGKLKKSGGKRKR